MAWLVHTRQKLCCEPQEFSPTASLQPFRPMTDEGRRCWRLAAANQVAVEYSHGSSVTASHKRLPV